jgi:hypothetical protein
MKLAKASISEMTAVFELPLQCAKALWHMPPGNPAFTTLPKIGANPTLDRRPNMVAGRP